MKSGSQAAGGGPREATIEAPQAPLVHLENAENGVTKNNSQFSSSSKKSKLSHPEDLKDSSPPIESRLVPASVASREASYGPSVSQRPWSVLARGTNKGKGLVDVGRMAGTHWCGLHHTVIPSTATTRCGKGWRADSAVEMGGYTGADRCCRHHDLGCPLRCPVPTVGQSWETSSSSSSSWLF